MYRKLFRNVKKRIGKKYRAIDPEDIFLDSTNLPGFDEYSFEGRIERPIENRNFLFLKGAFFIIVLLLGTRLWTLQVNEGRAFVKISENNRLNQALIIGNRGVIYDRNGLELVTNSIKEVKADYAARLYAPYKGLAHVLGYVKYPQKDSRGFYYDEEYKGQAGVEKTYNNILNGKNGLKLTETDALGNITSESVIEKPQDGQALNLSVDAKLSAELYKIIESFANERGYKGGAGVIMDIETGEIIALSSFPEYDPNVITAGSDAVEIKRLFNDPATPFLDRVTGGLYTPGSIIKPIVALGALNENLISPEKEILSTGALTLPNPYDPSKPSIFRDWKAHGWVDMRSALAVSSDVYFYAVGGGFEDQKGLGITKIDSYLKQFGLDELTGIDLPGEKSGVIASPDWKKTNFDDDWRLGDTYITSIGQYGTQITTLEAVRWVAAIANGGKLLIPTVVKNDRPESEKILRTLNFKEGDWKVIKEGMREAAEPGGTAAGLNVPYVKIAAKTGTAELGASKELVNSWSTGYFPYENPRYAFTILMEKGSRYNTVGATGVMRQLLDWMSLYSPNYFE
ncbi:MAG: penicillin-binding transpeptidase domain-containing protein [bacterium]|nr:penicillin-binding transpeptidase domain-containing protein [bacterium]